MMSGYMLTDRYTSNRKTPSPLEMFIPTCSADNNWNANFPEVVVLALRCRQLLTRQFSAIKLSAFEKCCMHSSRNYFHINFVADSSAKFMHIAHLWRICVFWALFVMVSGIFIQAVKCTICCVSA